MREGVPVLFPVAVSFGPPWLLVLQLLDLREGLEDHFVARQVVDSLRRHDQGREGRVDGYGVPFDGKHLPPGAVELPELAVHDQEEVALRVVGDPGAVGLGEGFQPVGRRLHPVLEQRVGIEFGGPQKARGREVDRRAALDAEQEQGERQKQEQHDLETGAHATRPRTRRADRAAA